MVTIVIIVVVVIVGFSVVTSVTLYFLVSGLTHSSGTMPYFLEMNVTSATGPSGTPATYYVTLSLGPQAGLSTAYFGLAVTDSVGYLQPMVATSSGCTYGVASPAASCLAGGAGWYAVLTNSTGAVIAAYALQGATGAWTHLEPGSSEVQLTTLDTLVVVSSMSYNSGGFRLSVVPAGPVPVSGSVAL